MKPTHSLGVITFVVLLLSCTRNPRMTTKYEVRLDSLTNPSYSRDQIISYLKGQFRQSKPLRIGDTIGGDDFWPIFIAGIPGRLYVSGWHKGPPGIEDDI